MTMEEIKTEFLPVGVFPDPNSVLMDNGKYWLVKV